MSENSDKKFGKVKLFSILAVVVTAAVVAVVTMNFISTTRLIEVSDPHDLDARGGTITFTYSKPVDRPLYKTSAQQMKTHVTLGKDKRTEVHTFIYPTPYKSSLSFVKISQTNNKSLSHLFSPPETIDVTTGIEKISIKAQGQNKTVRF